MANNVTTSPVKLCDGGSVALEVVGAGTVYVGQSATDPTVKGIPLASTNGVVFLQNVHGPLYGMTSTGTVDIRVLSL